MKKKNILLVLAGVAAAVGFFFTRKVKAEKQEAPPKGAPQLPLNNPGDQSEFITSAGESEDK